MLSELPHSAKRNSRAVVVAAITSALCLLGVAAASAPSAAEAATPTCLGEKATLVSSAKRIVGKKGHDVIVALGKGAKEIDGRGGNDRICGGPGPEKLVGGRGNDQLHGGGGNDKLFGGRGNDRLMGGSGDDELDGFRGNDRLEGDGGNDWLRGGRGNDRLSGGAGKDLVEGVNGDDFLDGDAGNDRLHGGPGTDRLRGGKGEDRLRGDSGGDFLDGGPGRQDIGSWSTAANGVVVTLSSTGKQTTFDGDDVVRAIEDLVGSAFPDTLSGNRSSNRIDGGAGFDELDGGGGRGDEAFGGPDGASCEGFSKRDNCISWDECWADDGEYPDYDYPDYDYPYTSQRNSCADLEDCLNDDYDYPDFEDYANTSRNMMSDCMDDPESNVETVVVLSRGLDGASFIVNGDDSNNRLTVSRQKKSLRVVETGSSAIGVGSTGESGCRKDGPKAAVCPFRGELGSVIVTGGDGDDTLKVGSAFGGRTKVRVNGGDGSDTLIGGPGDDVLEAGFPYRISNEGGPTTGRDRLYGNKGDDGLFADLGSDLLSGGPGADLLVSSKDVCQRHTLSGGAGQDNASWAQVGVKGEGYSGAMKMKIGSFGGPVSACPKERDKIKRDVESLEGSLLADTLIGDGGSNSFFGQAGADTFLGKGGQDFIDARDGERDRKIDCGGSGSAKVDSKDPTPIRCD